MRKKRDPFADNSIPLVEYHTFVHEMKKEAAFHPMDAAIGGLIGGAAGAYMANEAYKPREHTPKGESYHANRLKHELAHQIDVRINREDPSFKDRFMDRIGKARMRFANIMQDNTALRLLSGAAVGAATGVYGGHMIGNKLRDSVAVASMFPKTSAVVQPPNTRPQLTEAEKAMLLHNARETGGLSGLAIGGVAGLGLGALSGSPWGAAMTGSLGALGGSLIGSRFAEGRQQKEILGLGKQSSTADARRVCDVAGLKRSLLVKKAAYLGVSMEEAAEMELRAMQFASQPYRTPVQEAFLHKMAEVQAQVAPPPPPAQPLGMNAAFGEDIPTEVQGGSMLSVLMQKQRAIQNHDHAGELQAQEMMASAEPEDGRSWTRSERGRELLGIFGGESSPMGETPDPSKLSSVRRLSSIQKRASTLYDDMERAHTRRAAMAWRAG